MSEVVEQTYIKDFPVKDLIPHPDNPRRGKVEVIQESIQENGFYGSILIQKSTGYVIAGNHRLRAAQEEGLNELPVLIADVDDVTASKILAADNRTSDLAINDERELAEFLSSIQATDSLLGTGYTDSDLDGALKSLSDRESGLDWKEALGFSEKERDGFETMTFTLSADQAETIRLALERAKPHVAELETINQNNNGNALYLIAIEYVG